MAGNSRKILKVIGNAFFGVTPHFVIADGRENKDMVRLPEGCLVTKHLPICIP